MSPAKDRPSTVTEKVSVISTKANIPSNPTAPPTETPSSASSNNVVESNNPHDGTYADFDFGILFFHFFCFVYWFHGLASELFSVQWKVIPFISRTCL